MILVNTLMMAEFCGDTPKVICKITASHPGCFVNRLPLNLFLISTAIVQITSSVRLIGFSRWQLEDLAATTAMAEASQSGCSLSTFFVHAPPFIFVPVVLFTVMWNYSFQMIKTCLLCNWISNTHIGILLQSCAYIIRGGNDKNTKNIFLPFGVFITWDP